MWENADTLMAPAPAVDKWGADGFIAKLPPAGVLTGIKILPYKRGQRTREYNFSQLRDEFSRSDSLKEKGWMGGGRLLGASASAPQERWGALDRASKSLGRTSERHMA